MEKKITILKLSDFVPNPQIKPSFPEDELVLLKKDYTNSQSNCSRFLEEGALCLIVECGLSEEIYDQKTMQWYSFKDTDEWCAIYMPADEEEDGGFVKAKDLRIYYDSDSDECE